MTLLIMPNACLYADLGHAVTDDTQEYFAGEPPSIATTKRLIEELDKHDFVMHVGDIAYAEGYSTTVSVIFWLVVEWSVFVCF